MRLKTMVTMATIAASATWLVAPTASQESGICRIRKARQFPFTDIEISWEGSRSPVRREQ
jgi:hypothetical protein